MTDQELRTIYDECAGDLAQVAQRLGLSYPEFVQKHGQTLIPRPSSFRRRQPPNDLGRPEIRQFIVSKRHADVPVWPREDEDKIDAARAKYEAGTHEICQGRDRNWFIMYLIPRKQRTTPRKFFHINE